MNNFFVLSRINFFLDNYVNVCNKPQSYFNLFRSSQLAMEPPWRGKLLLLVVELRFF